MSRWVSCLVAGLLASACATGSGVAPRSGEDGGATLDEDGSTILDAGPPDADGDGTPDHLDCAPDDPTIGAVAEEACTSDCATSVRTCADGVWGECQAPTSCTCTSDERREVACDGCGGLRAQRCEDGTWVDDGTCVTTAECVPGEREVEASESCGLGGERTRECSGSCTYGSWACTAGTPIGLWVLPTGASTWHRYGLDPSGSPFAPTETIEAAFSLEDRNEAYVLTRTRFHVLRPSDRQWLRSGRRADLFPEAAGVQILAAYATPARLTGSARPDVTLTSRGTVYAYPGFDAATGSSDAPFSAPCCTEQWPGPRAPTVANVHGMWVDPDNAERWPSQAAPGCSVPETFYFAVAAAPGRVHVQDPACAFAFSETTPFGSFSPFTLPDAPRFEDVGAAFFLSGLFVLAP